MVIIFLVQMYVNQLLEDGHDPTDSLWYYPNSIVSRRAAEQRGEKLEGLEIHFYK